METKFPSPDGIYQFQIFPWEARMSLWVETPRLVHIATEKVLLTFRDENWSLDSAQWRDDATVEISLRKYPGAHQPSSFQVVIDCIKQQACLMGAPPIALEDLEAALEAML